jgi:glyoxylase-like metal-dependent hydrolase (beta-lactamase superfamily II)
MQKRRELFPHVIEMNHQARRRLGCCVYLVFDRDEWLLIDIGYEDTVREIIDLIRSLDFPLSQCKYLVVTHADADHVQGLKAARALLPNAKTVGHPLAAQALAQADRILTYAEIPAQGISIELAPIELDQTINEGDVLKVGGLALETWHTPGHTQSQLAFRMGELLFSGDNIFRDGCVGNIDAHHGSDILHFIQSLERIRASDVRWLLPSHGPAFAKDDRLLEETIERLKRYSHMADFGTCAVDWPLLEEWEKELAERPADETGFRAAGKKKGSQRAGTGHAARS